MKISTESVNEAKQTAEHRADEQKTSDRFSQVLKSKNKESQDKLAGNKGDGGDAKQKTPAVVIDPLPLNPLVADASASRLSGPSTAVDPERIAQPGSSASSQIDKLTTEIVHQIDIVKQGGKTESINVTFDSKTLEGLQVQIRQQDGQLAIRFVTHSDNVSNLLSRHTGELQESLTSKGVKIRNIVISNTSTPPEMQRFGNARA